MLSNDELEGLTELRKFAEENYTKSLASGASSTDIVTPAKRAKVPSSKDGGAKKKQKSSEVNAALAMFRTGFVKV